MKAVEIRVRKLARLGDEMVGVPLMNAAFNERGPLTHQTAVKGEREGLRALFAGSYAVLRNPPGHRELNFDDVSEAAEMVHTASLLLRILDRVEARLERASTNSSGACSTGVELRTLWRIVFAFRGARSTLNAL
jgi:uncharacterized protein (TIGR02391 family)